MYFQGFSKYTATEKKKISLHLCSGFLYHLRVGFPPPLCGLHYHLCVGNSHLRVASSLPMYCGSFCCCALRAVPSRFVGLTNLVRGFPFLSVGSFIACDFAGRLVGLTDPVCGFPFLPVGLVYSLWCCWSSQLRLWSCLS